MATIEQMVEKMVKDKEIDRKDECAATTILTWWNEGITSARKVSSYYVDKLIAGGFGTRRGILNVDDTEIGIWFCLAIAGCYGLLEQSPQESSDATE